MLKKTRSGASSSGSSRPRSLTSSSGGTRVKAASPRTSSAKTTYESIVECQDRIYHVLDQFDKLEDIGKDLKRVQKPDDSAYVLRYDEKELIALSDNIDKMTFKEEDFIIKDEEEMSIQKAIDESGDVITLMVNHKQDEMNKIKELVEKFRQLRLGQELQLGNTVREIKEASGVRNLETKLLDREMQVARIRGECTKKEELLKLILSGLDETELHIREMCEQFEMEKIQKLTDSVKLVEGEIKATLETAQITSDDLKHWRAKLSVLMKDVENAEISEIRKKKERLIAELNKKHDDYNIAFAAHAQNLKYLILTEKRANDNKYDLEKLGSNKDAKLIRSLQTKVDELQDFLAIGKVKLEELEAYLGDPAATGDFRRWSKQHRSRGSIKSQSSGDHLSQQSSKDPIQESGMTNEEQPDGPAEEVLISDGALSAPSDRIGSDTGSGPEENRGPSMEIEVPSTRTFRIVHTTALASISEIRKISKFVLEPVSATASKGISSPLGNAFYPHIESLKIGPDGKVNVPDKSGPLKAIDQLKDALSLICLPQPPSLSALHKEEDLDMITKENRLLNFAANPALSDQLSQILQDGQLKEVSFPQHREMALSLLDTCKSNMANVLAHRPQLNSMSGPELINSLTKLRERISEISMEMRIEEAKLHEARTRMETAQMRWEYKCGKLAESISLVAPTVGIAVPTEVELHTIYSELKSKQRAVEKWKERVLKAQEAPGSININEGDISGNISEFDDDFDDDIQVHVNELEVGTVKENSSSSSDSEDSDPSGDEFGNAHPETATVVQPLGRVSNMKPLFSGNRRRVSSVITAKTVVELANSGFIPKGSVKKSVGHRVLNMVTREEIEEKERMERETKAKVEKGIAKTDKKEPEMTEFQKALMSEIRDSVEQILNRASGEKVAKEKQAKKGTIISLGGDHKKHGSVVSRIGAELNDGAMGAEMERRQMILSMIGRSVARATNAALQAGLEQQRRQNFFEEIPDEEGALSDKNKWKSGKYDHNIDQKISGGIAEILSLISESDHSQDLKLVREDLLVPADNEISNLIDKLSMEVSQNFIETSMLSPRLVPPAPWTADSERQDTSNLEEMYLSEAALLHLPSDNKKRLGSDDENSSFGTALSDAKQSEHKTKIFQRRKEKEKGELTSTVAQYSNKRSAGHSALSTRKTSVCDIQLPVTVSMLSSEASTIEQPAPVKVANQLKAEPKRTDKSEKVTPRENVPSLLMHLPDDVDASRSTSTFKRTFGGRALHPTVHLDHSKKKAGSHPLFDFRSARCPVSARPILDKNAPSVEDLPRIEDMSEGAVGEGPSVSRPITSLDGDFVPTVVAEEVSKSISLLSPTRIVIPAPEAVVDSRITTATNPASRESRNKSDSFTDEIETVGESPDIDDSFAVPVEQSRSLAMASTPRRSSRKIADSSGENWTTNFQHTTVVNAVDPEESVASSFFHEWSEGPESDFAAVLLSSSQAGTSHSAPRPPQILTPSSQSSTPLRRRVLKQHLVWPSRPGRSAADAKILYESALRHKLQIGMHESKSSDAHHRTLDEILEEIEKKGAIIQDRIASWNNLNSMGIHIDELDRWRRNLKKLKITTSKKSKDSLSSEFSAMLRSEKRLPDVKIDSSLIGYVDTAPLFDWEHCVKMNRSTVKQLVAMLSKRSCQPGRIDEPTVIALLPHDVVEERRARSEHKFSVTVPEDVLEEARDSKSRIETYEELDHSMETAAMNEQPRTSMDEKKPTMKLSAKKKSSNAWSTSGRKHTPLDGGNMAVETEDGRLVFVIRKPPSIG